MFPEIQIKKLLDFFISKIDEKYLYRVFEDLSLDGYDFAENAKAIFLKGGEAERHVETHLFFNFNRANLPTIHLNLPSESMGGDNGLMWGVEDMEAVCEQSSFKITDKTYNSKFNLIFTSSNTFEVLIMYYVIKSMIQGNIELLENNGLRNAKISGSDIIFNEGFMPQGIYSRAISLDCIYTFRGISINEITPITNVTFNGEMKS